MTSELRPTVETRAEVLDQLLSELLDGNAWDSTMSMLNDYADLVQDLLKDREAALNAQAEAEALRARVVELEVRLAPQWFYAEGYDQDGCCDSPEQVLEYLDLKPGDNVVQVDCAGPLPSLWYVVHIRTDEEMEALETDDREVFTQYPSEEAARKALEAKP